MGRPTQEPAGPLALAIAREVRKEIGDKRVSGRALALSIGKSESYVRARLADKTDFTINDIERFCAAYDLDALEFISRAEVAAAAVSVGGSQHAGDVADMDDEELRSRYDLAADSSIDTSDPDLRTP